MNLSQSALSIQIKQLEERLQHDLFERKGRSLVLTEAGRIALDHADRIFATGADLIATLARSDEIRPPLRVGALSTVSRNFQMQFLRPVLQGGEADVSLKSGGAAELYAALRALALDVVLTTEAPHSDTGSDFIAHRIAEQPVGAIGTPERLHHATLSELLSHEPLILPNEAAIQTGFDSLVARLGITPHILAHVDDMAMVRLLARENAGVAIAPPVVLQDEIASGRLVAAPFDLDIAERFFAVTIERNFPHHLLAGLLPG
jgi:LysR family transcriptional activator of nhaA